MTLECPDCGCAYCICDSDDRDAVLPTGDDVLDRHYAALMKRERVPTVAPKPADYHARRRWQDEARARGETPECGREACHNPALPAWVNKGTPLLYCTRCARLINGFNPGLCTLEEP